MNILMALSQIEVTGAESYAASISDFMIDKGHKVYIISDTFTKKTKANYEPLALHNRRIINRIYNVWFVYNFIKKNNIEIIHAHSRASGWVGFVASRLANIPMVTTVHGRQPVHPTRKMMKLFGEKIIAVCENIRDHLINEIKVSSKEIVVLHNGIETERFTKENKQARENKKIISVIGRLSGPKGEFTYELVKRILIKYKDKYKISIVGGSKEDHRFVEFSDFIEMAGYVDNIQERMEKSAVVIGAGRVAIEAILSETPLVAAGESRAVGFITENNIQEGIASNFGDIGLIEGSTYDWEFIENEIKRALEYNENLKGIKEIVSSEYKLETVAENIEKIYRKVIFEKNEYEIPILMYHRVIRTEEEEGENHIFVWEKQFDLQMNFLKRSGYNSITFEDLEKVDIRDKRKKYVIITFDDGYEDNYQYAFPILKKYGFKAVIYITAEMTYNKWDVDKGTEKKFDLMNDAQIKEMMEYGIEFGGHSDTHADLTTLSDSELKKEIIESKIKLEKKFGKNFISFAYPFGRLNNKAKELVKLAGYKYGIATDSGSISIKEDLFQIRRIGVFPKNNIFNFIRKVSGKYTILKANKKK